MYRMLIVDDEPLIAQGMSRAVERTRLFEVATANDGRKALDLLMEKPFDAMLLDIAMPDMDGLQLMEALSARGMVPETVVISGFEEFDYAQRAMSYGAKDYILKPVSPKDVAAIAVRLSEKLDARRREQREREELRRFVKTQRDVINEMLNAPEPLDPARLESLLEGAPGEGSSDLGEKEKRIARRVRSCLEENYADSALTVNGIAQAMNYSANYLGNAFRREYGMTVSDYLTRLRIDIARKLMEDTGLKFYEIAFRVGFNDQHYFSRIFRRVVGLSPREYRVRHARSTTDDHE